LQGFGVFLGVAFCFIYCPSSCLMRPSTEKSEDNLVAKGAMTMRPSGN
jgi:hypothetical protein